MSIARRAGAGTLSQAPWYPPLADGAIASSEVQQAVGLFLALEAEAFDDQHLEQWADMVEESFTYRVPVPVVRDTLTGPSYDPGSLLIDETKESMVEIWFARLGDQLYDLAWGEHPPLRFRHHISNVRVRLTDEPDLFLARSNVVLTMVRQATDPAQLGAERYDLVRRTADWWALSSRYCLLDAVVLNVPQVRVLL
ncbi:MAG: aromatic-ring-hydroxylating dioxygenase subunit beta [Acidimicrobiales bacterium]